MLDQQHPVISNKSGQLVQSGYDIVQSTINPHLIQIGLFKQGMQGSRIVSQLLRLMPIDRISGQPG
jgi:hypothetical protein